MSSTISTDSARVEYSAPPDPAPTPTPTVVADENADAGGGQSARLYEAQYDARVQRYELESRLPTVQPVSNAAENEGALADEKRELLLDITQIGLSIVGIFEPTPFADGADGIISLFRGDFWGAGISAAGMIPYVGDLAKLGKLPKFLKIVERAVTIAKADAKFAESLRPALRTLKEALDKVPLDSLPKAAREQIQAMRGKIDEFFSAERRNVRSHEATPGNGLQGHTLSQHVGRSESWLRNRLAQNPRLTFASSFRNEAVANRVQGQFVKQNRAEIEAWLKSGAGRPFTREVTMKDPVGIVVERGRSGHLETSRASVTIIRDNSPQGWHVLTSYPVK